MLQSVVPDGNRVQNVPKSQKRRQKKLLKRQSMLQAPKVDDAIKLPVESTNKKRHAEDDLGGPSAKLTRVEASETPDVPKSADLNEPAKEAVTVDESRESLIDPKTLADLTAVFKLTDLHINTGSKIETKVTYILETLSEFSFVQWVKPNVILLHAKGPAITKLISVIEIAKRELANQRVKYYQYNRLESLTEERERPVLPKFGNLTVRGQPEHNDAAEDSLEETAFETMQLPIDRALEGRPMKRAVPSMVIYLSRLRSEVLKKLFEEQTNDETNRRGM